MAGRTAILPALAAAVLAAGPLGCASANVKTNKDETYTKKLDRMLIVFPLDEYMQAYETLLQERMIAELQKRGVASSFAKVSGQLALENAPPLEAQAQEFNASSFLFIRRAGGVVNQYGGLVNARFDAQLFDRASKARVWRAAISYNPGGMFAGDSQRVDALVGELVKALANDGLL
jgi:hypothetical protein